MKKWACFALVLCLCLTLVGCGSTATEDATTTTTNKNTTPIANPDLKVEDCYTYTENKDGTYSCAVEWRGGGRIYVKERMERPVSFATAGEDQLIIEGQSGTGVGARWAIVCDIERGRTSNTYAGYLAAVADRIAYLDYRTDKYHVFVCDPYAPDAVLGACTLEGVVVPEGGDPVKEFALSKEGVLTVTYPTASGDKTVTVDLTAK